MLKILSPFTLSFLIGFFIIAMMLSCGKTTMTWEKPFFFIQMADPQFGMISGNQGFAEETRLFEKAIACANELKPAFVIVSGDLINKPGDSTQADEFLRIANQLDKSIPIYLVAGNHDVENVQTEKSLAWYRGKFGREIYAFEHGGCAGIVLNSLLLKNPEATPDETQKQLTWLEMKLKRFRDRGSTHVFIFVHHPFFLHEAAEPDEYFNVPIATRQNYLALFQKYGVTAIFAGHYHRNSLGKFAKIDMITTGPVGMPLGADSSGFRIVRVYSDRIEHDYYGLDATPTREEILQQLSD